jgi:hypothetical protein
LILSLLIFLSHVVAVIPQGPHSPSEQSLSSLFVAAKRKDKHCYPIEMDSFRLMIFTLSFILLIHTIFSLKYESCVPKAGVVEKRRLFVATCDTRSGWKEFNSLKAWNNTGFLLRSQGVTMSNVCSGKNWGANGYLTKPLIYLDYLKQLAIIDTVESPIYVILMDSDTFWAVNDVATIWNKFDCARGTKEVVLATEMSCWVGRYCRSEDLTRWYKNATIEITPSYSPFVNSGIVMGSVPKVHKMLDYVVVHNRSYYITYTNKHKFDDQYAIADYAIKVAPEDVALDYHQALLASFSIHAPADPPDDPGWPFVCKNKLGKLDTSCPNWTMKLGRAGHYKMNKTTCTLQRNYWNQMPVKEELESLANDPIIWHGNGAGKRFYQQYGFDAFKCSLERRNMTEQDHTNSYG